MKKFLLTIVMAVALVLPVAAGDWFPQSFLNSTVAALKVTNATTAATYGGGITNLDVWTMHIALSDGAKRTNVSGTEWTNTAGQWIAVTNYSAASNALSYVNLLSAVEMWPDANGNWTPPTWRQNYNWSVAAYPSNFFDEITTTNFNCNMQLCIQLLTVDAAANAAVNFRFAPSVSGAGGYSVSTNIADMWTVGVTPTALTGNRVCILTNVPTYKWPGCKKLYLVDIANTDQTANSAVWITEISANGWKP